MGQSPVCSFCSDQEREQNLNSQNNFLIPENKNITLMERPILKENKETNSFNLKYIEAIQHHPQKISSYFVGLMIVKLKDILRMVLQPVREYISIGKLYIQRKICKR